MAGSGPIIDWSRVFGTLRPELISRFFEHMQLTFLAVLIGFFCMTQAVFLAREALSGEKGVHIVFEGIMGIWRVMKTMFSAFWTYARATVIGIFLGIMPAIGPESTPFVAHAIEKWRAVSGEAIGSPGSGRAGSARTRSWSGRRSRTSPSTRSSTPRCPRSTA